MPRQARLDAPGTLHHVMLRGIERRAIVTDNADRHEFVSRLGTSAMQSRTSVYGWALLTNHAHLLLRSGPDGLPRLMRRFLTGYAQAYNRRHQRHGHLFQNRYKSIECEEDRYFVELLRYIHLNPLRARLVRTLSELERYPWSGHGVLLGEVAGSWQEREWVLSWFGKTADSAIQAYREFVAEGVGQERRPELVGGGQVRSGGGWSVVRGRSRQKAADGRILGGEVFVATVLREAEERIRRQLAVPRNQSSLAKAIERVCRQAGISSRELQAGSRRRPVSKIRALLAQRLVSEFILKTRPNRCTKQFPHGILDFPSVFPPPLGVDRIARQNNSTNSTTSPFGPFARSKYPALHFQVGDMMAVRLQRCFDAILCMGSAVMYALTNEEVDQVLDTFVLHAHPGTLLILDINNAASYLGGGTFREQTEYAVDRTAFPASSIARHGFDRRRQLLVRRRTWSIPGHPPIEDFCEYRLFFPAELEHLLDTKGFRVLGVFDNRDLRETNLSGPRLYVAAILRPLEN